MEQSFPLREEILSLAEKVSTEKFSKRQEDFLRWIQQFLQRAATKDISPNDIRFLNGMNETELSLYLNFHYWKMAEWVRKLLKDSAKQPYKVLNRYKIAATTEYVIMRAKPIRNKSNEPIVALNADFAFYITLRIILSWDHDKHYFNIEGLKKFFVNDKATREFVEEHRTWLQYHAAAHQHLILSNMQTLRLFHYWFKEPKENFSPHPPSQE